MRKSYGIQPISFRRASPRVSLSCVTRHQEFHQGSNSRHRSEREYVMLKSHISGFAGFFHSKPSRWLAAASLAILTALVFTLASVAANDAILPRSNHAQASKSQRSAGAANPSSSRENRVQVLNAGLWRTDRGFNTTIRVTNLLVLGPLEVVPVLYMADGTRYELPSMTLPTAGEVELNVNDALRAWSPAVAPHVSEFGSASLEYRYFSPGALSATIQILDLTRSLIFTYCFGPAGGTQGSHTVEGVWWKHDEDVTGFVSLTNTTNRVLGADLTLLGANGKESKERSFTLQGRSVQLVDLGELSERFRSKVQDQGGIRVEYQGASGDLLVTAGIQNDATGYSATVPFLMREGDPVKEAPHTYASVGMMVGMPDPMMSFPATTRFAPYAVLRNTTNKPLVVTSAIVYTNGGQPATVQVPLKPLKPFSTEDIGLESLMSALGLGSLDGMINLAFTFNGRVRLRHHAELYDTRPTLDTTSSRSASERELAFGRFA